MTAQMELSSLLIPLLLFTLLATATPGPNNSLLTLSGSRFGYRQTLPFIFGIRAGITGLFILMGSGIGGILSENPHWYFYLKILGAGYLVYLAVKVAFSGNRKQHNHAANLIGFRQGALLQFINPKSMMMVLSCITAFSLPGELYLLSVLQACLIFNLVGLMSNSAWTLFGALISRLLSTEQARDKFNKVLALLTLLAVALLFI
ncbi:LysE family translocator [Thalassomonas viridans]|uniref:LysE family translocator n=1 Tax=Thalassomonas viridans TaxID=137584 RepID=A0AAE9Z3J6_9GAMM|nr:LysE family translocator [Thalassomonas viridans]WDE05913.1 LysE family translocator [Thalassomonas viridans]